MSVKIVLQNAKAQLEAQKSKTYQDAYNMKYADMKSELETYTAEKRREYDEAVSHLKAAYDEAIADKKASFDSAASAYAQMQVSNIENSIAELQKLIDNETEV